MTSEVNREKHSSFSFSIQAKESQKNVTNFDDLPNEILLLLCPYLKPSWDFNAFFHCHQRLSRCIEEYYQNIDLTKSSYFDLLHVRNAISESILHPSKLTLSNAEMPDQIQIFSNRCDSSTTFSSTTLQHLSLLEYRDDICYKVSSFLSKCRSLQSLTIIESTSTKNLASLTYTYNNMFRGSIFYEWTTLTELVFTTNSGIIFSKKMPQNSSLVSLTISVRNINDLYVLLDGVVPNLRFLRVTVCQSDIDERSTLPDNWPRHSMSHLNEFYLTTTEKVPFTLDHLRHIVVTVKQIHVLTLVIAQWTNNNGNFIEGHQLEMLMEEFLPQLRRFHCFIQTTTIINIQSFAKISQRWPMKFHSKLNHVYTIPWSFPEFSLSILADDDTTSVSPIVQTLIIDKVCSNISHHFPNIHTLIIHPDGNLCSSDWWIAFHHLRHLTVPTIQRVPPSVIRRLHTLTISTIDDLVNDPIIYSNIQHLIIKNNQIGSSSLLIALIQHFPSLRVFEIQLELNDNYYDNLDILLNEKYLPNLCSLKTSWIERGIGSWETDLMLETKTRLRWRSIIFHGYFDGDVLTISL